MSGPSQQVCAVLGALREAKGLLRHFIAQRAMVYSASVKCKWKITWERAGYFRGVRRRCCVRASNCTQTAMFPGGLLSLQTRGGSWVCVSPAAGMDTLGPSTTRPGAEPALCRGHGEGSSFSCLEAASMITLSLAPMCAAFCSAGPGHPPGYGEISGSVQASSVALPVLWAWERRGACATLTFQPVVFASGWDSASPAQPLFMLPACIISAQSSCLCWILEVLPF